MDARKRYELLLERASSTRSIDAGRNTIYSFPKYCKSCRCGLKAPREWERRTIKALFKAGFCSVECKAAPRANQSTFPLKTKEKHEPNKNHVAVVEEMAFASIEVDREKNSSYGIKRMVEFCERSFRYLDEKLRYMEQMTGKRWYPGRYYYWKAKLK